MLNRNQWLHQHDEFVSQSQTLLQRSQECVAHLQMIADDEDAIACLHISLLSLANEAIRVSLGNVAEFIAQLQHRLVLLVSGNALNAEAIDTFKRGLGLLAWQLELVDPHTGELPLDDDEQHELLARLGRLASPAC